MDKRKLYEKIMSKVAKEVKKALLEGETLDNANGKWLIIYFNDTEANFFNSGEYWGMTYELTGAYDSDDIDEGIRECPEANHDRIEPDLSNLPAPVEMDNMGNARKTIERIWSYLEELIEDANIRQLNIEKYTGYDSVNDLCDYVLNDGGIFELPDEGNLIMKLVDVNELKSILRKCDF